LLLARSLKPSYISRWAKVAVKVQRPGIDNTVAQDVALIRGVAALVARTEFGQNYRDRFSSRGICHSLQAELDFTREAGYTDQLRRNLADGRWFDSKQLVVAEICWI